MSPERRLLKLSRPALTLLTLAVGAGFFAGALFSAQAILLSGVGDLLLRFWDHEGGTIRIGGQELHTLPADDVRKLLGVVPQHLYLFKATIHDNLYLANPSASEADFVAASRQAQLAVRERQRRRFVAVDDSARQLLSNADTPAPRLRPSSPLRPLTYPRNR